jgi:hypothetical protein
MKYVWMTLFGSLVGALAGAALLFFNPLIDTGDPSLAGFDRMMRYSLPDDAIVVTHGGMLPLERRPFGVEPLWESTIRSTSLATLVLRSDSGEPQAVASRVVWPSKRTELLTAGVLANDHWLVSVPGEGAFFVVAESNVSTMAKDTLVAVKLLGRAWQAPRAYAPIEGPEIAGTALVIGASGSFAGRAGRALERYRIERFARAAGLEAAAAEMHFVWDAPVETLPPGAQDAASAERAAGEGETEGDDVVPDASLASDARAEP